MAGIDTIEQKVKKSFEKRQASKNSLAHELVKRVLKPFNETSVKNAKALKKRLNTSYNQIVDEKKPLLLNLKEEIIVELNKLKAEANRSHKTQISSTISKLVVTFGGDTSEKGKPYSYKDKRR